MYDITHKKYLTTLNVRYINTFSDQNHGPKTIKKNHIK